MFQGSVFVMYAGSLGLKQCQWVAGEDAGHGATTEGQHLREAPAHRQLAGVSDSEDDGADGSYSEEDIVLIMEFASLGRAAAIELLQDFGGDTESVLANMFP